MGEARILKVLYKFNICSDILYKLEAVCQLFHSD